jgi:hypothetical protein
MMPKDKNSAKNSLGHEAIESLMNMIGELIERYGKNLNVEHIKEVLAIICAHDDILNRGISNPNDFLTIADIEHLIMEEGRLVNDANLKSLVQSMKKVEGEEIAIAQKKTPSGKKGRGPISGDVTRTP